MTPNKYKYEKKYIRFDPIG